MKYLGLFLVLFSLNVFAQKTSLENTKPYFVCDKGVQGGELTIESCHLGLRVLQGLYVAQDQKRFPEGVDLKALEWALRSGNIQITKPSEYFQMDREKKANYLYQQMIRATGQAAPSLKPSGAIELPGRAGTAMSTGSRGGGFDTDETSLSEDLWY
ncbi:MAG: hypothetical protein AAGB31_13835 [Bdellovibrio sp.]